MELRLLGEIQLGDKTRVSDPCYSKDLNCAAVIDTLPGHYQARFHVQNEGSWGNRVSYLEIVHKDFLNSNLAYLTTGKYLGVDSGQLGFFDDSKYPQEPGNWNEGEDNFYSRCCDANHSNRQECDTAAIVTEGCLSSTGYGDGSYGLYTAKNSNGDIIAAKVVFIDDDEELTMDDDW